MNFYPFNDIETISPRPMLFITGDAGALHASSARTPTSAPPSRRNCSSCRGAGHVDLYDRVNLIPFDKLTSFFTQHLAERAQTVVGSAAR